MVSDVVVGFKYHVYTYIQSTNVKTEGKKETENSPQSSSQDNDIQSIASNRIREGKCRKSMNIKSQNIKPTDSARMCKICYNVELEVAFLVYRFGRTIVYVKRDPGMTSCVA